MIDLCVYHTELVSMQQDNKRYLELAEKWLNGTINKEEMNEFSAWYDEVDDHPLQVPLDFASSEEELRQRILSRIKSRQRFAAVFSIRNFRTAGLVAASILLIFSGLLVFQFLRSDRAGLAEKKTVATGHQEIDGVVPGGNKAVLIMADGSQVELDTAGNGTISETANARVIKLNDGELALSAAKNEIGTLTYNILKTPRGGQYTITLSDGSRVWLNSASSLRFPTVFGKERNVELTGEAYFEVARNPERPFKVKANGTEVRVLGTHFNIMAYDDERLISATLIEGSIRISKDDNLILLKPGQQANVTEDGKIGVLKNADVEQAIAWKNGVFNFNGSDIQSTMRQIARWYDVEVIYENKIAEHFNGTIPRNSSIENVLKMLEYTGVVRFVMHNRQIIVRH